MKRDISFVFNGNPMRMMIQDHWTLLHLIREELGYTGTKEGCGSGECGACTVIVNGKAVRSCITRVGSLDGADVRTVEGLGSPENHHPIQEAFSLAGAIQCGYCTPAMVMVTKSRAGILALRPQKTPARNGTVSKKA